VDFFKDSGNTIKRGQFSKSFKTPQKLTALFCIFDASFVEILPSHSNPAYNTIPISACPIEKTG